MAQQDLVVQAATGDSEAFASLAASHVDGCYALAYRILRDPHRAQDACQQALLGAWRDLPTLREPERFDAWLHRLVVHACYSEARGTRRWNSARVRVLPLNDVDPDPASSVADRDSSRTPSAGCHRNIGRSSSSITTWGIRSRRSRRLWACPSGPRGPAFTTRSVSCGPCSTRTSRPPRPSRSDPHDTDRTSRSSTPESPTGSRTTHTRRRSRHSTSCSPPSLRSRSGTQRASRGGSSTCLHHSSSPSRRRRSPSSWAGSSCSDH